MTTAIAICLTIQLQLLNDANVPADVLAAAQREIVSIFARGGIEIVWHDDASETPPAYRFAVKIAPNSLGYRHTQPHVMGIALRGERSGTIVYAFFGRVEAFAREQRIPSGKFLAYVIAHEVGHLLLPKGSHSQQGLMRGTWDREQVEGAVRGELTFTPDEIRTIRVSAPSR